MPTYGYECLGCERQFEIVQSIKDDALTTCDVCGGTLRKRIYPVGIAFKGSGFYVNDYARKSESTASESTSEPKADTKTDAKPAETKTEAKPETKPETPKPEKKSEPASAAS